MQIYLTPLGRGATWQTYGPIRPADEIYKRFGPKNAAESIW
jgi:hypothetical protein